MAGFNQTIFWGRVGNDLALKYTQGGTAVVGISLATSRRQKKRGSDEYEEVTSWHRLKVFGRQAEVLAEHTKKGDALFVECRVDYWEAKSDRGAKLMVAEFIVEHFEFCGSPRGSSEASPRPERPARPQGNTPPATGQQAPPANDFFDDDIPF